MTPRKSISALTQEECGRGVHLSEARAKEIEEWCAEAAVIGVTQTTMCSVLGASMSRVSRWVKRGLRRTGARQTFGFRRPRGRSLQERLEERIMPEPNSGCWLWLGGIKPGGYGSFNLSGVGAGQAHRMVFEMYRGPIPNGYVLDHTCRQRCCVNPDHLDIVTQPENVARGVARRVRR